MVSESLLENLTELGRVWSSDFGFSLPVYVWERCSHSLLNTYSFRVQFTCSILVSIVPVWNWMKYGASIEITGISGHSWEYALLRQPSRGEKLSEYYPFDFCGTED